MVMAKAEELKGQADIMEEKRQGIQMQLTDANEKNKQKVDVEKLYTPHGHIKKASDIKHLSDGTLHAFCLCKG